MNFFDEIKRITYIHCEIMGYSVAPSIKNDIGFEIPASIRKRCAQGCDREAIQNDLCLPCAKSKYNGGTEEG